MSLARIGTARPPTKPSARRVKSKAATGSKAQLGDSCFDMLASAEPPSAYVPLRWEGQGRGGEPNRSGWRCMHRVTLWLHGLRPGVERTKL